MQCTTKGHFGSFTASTAAHLTQTNRMATDWTGSMGTNLKWADLSEASFNHAQMEAARLRDALFMRYHHAQWHRYLHGTSGVRWVQSRNCRHG